MTLGWRYGTVELVGLLPTALQHLRETVAEGIANQVGHGLGQAKANCRGLSRPHLELVVRGGLGPLQPRIYGFLPARDDEIVDPVLYIRPRVGRAEDSLIIGLVLGEEQRGLPFAIEEIVAEFGIGRGNAHDAVLRDDRSQGGLRRFGPPSPDIAKPERGKHVNRRHVRAAIAHADLDQNVGWRLLGVFHEDIEVAILVENASINQLVLRFSATAPPVRLDQITIRKFTLRIFVEHLHVRVGRRIVDVEVVLLDIFAVVPLAVGQAEHTLLEYGILAVPQSKGKAQTLLFVAEAGDAVLAPVIGARARLIVGKVAPGVAVLAVVLPDRSPLALAEVRPPQLPWGPDVPALLKARLFRCSGVIHD